MRYAIIDSGTVRNVAAASADFAPPAGWVRSDVGQIGDHYDAGTGQFGRPAVDLPALQAASVATINAEYDRRVLVLSSGYPAAERESWPVQTAEARALRGDSKAVTPWIDAAAAARGIPRADLAARIVALDDAYRSIHGGLSGTRQRLEAEILAARTAEAVAAVAWPPETSA